MNKSELINDILSPQNISILSDKIISKNKALTSMTSSFFSTIFNFMIQNEVKLKKK